MGSKGSNYVGMWGGGTLANERRCPTSGGRGNTPETDSEWWSKGEEGQPSDQRAVASRCRKLTGKCCLSWCGHGLSEQAACLDVGAFSMRNTSVKRVKATVLQLRQLGS
jgi:hypothetical protein